MCISKKTKVKNVREEERERAKLIYNYIYIFIVKIRENPFFFFENKENPIGFQLLSNFTPCFLFFF